MALPKYPSNGSMDNGGNNAASPPSPTTPVHTIHTPRNKWAMLAVLALGLSLIVIDGAIVNVSLPVIIRSIDLTLTQAQWVASLYFIVFAALLLTVGTLADRIGRRTTFVIGVVIFVLGSILAASSLSGSALIASRAVQGVGGAFILPSTLSNLHTHFHGKDRFTAFAVWGSVISAMAALAPLLGGLITTYADWRWIFLINVPIGAVILIATFFFVPNTRGRDVTPDTATTAANPAAANPAAAGDASPDEVTTARLGFCPVGIILSVIGMGTFTFGLIEGQHLGWLKPAPHADYGSLWPANATISPIPVALIVGIVSLILFIAWEYRRTNKGKPVLLNMNLFRYRTFLVGNITAMMVAIGEFSLLFLLPLFLVNCLNLSTLAAGGVLATMALGAFLAGALASTLSQRITSVGVVIIGLGLEVVGVALLAAVLNADSSPHALAAILVIYGFGLGLASAQLTSTVLSDVPVSLAGVGSSTQSTFRQMGSAGGAAVSGAALAAALHSKLPDMIASVGAPPPLVDKLTEITIRSAGSNLPSTNLPPFDDILRLGFTDSVSASMWVSMGFLLIGFLGSLYLWYFRHLAHPDIPRGETVRDKQHS